MYSGSQRYPYKDINTVLQKYNQEELFFKYTGIYPDLNKQFYSIFRQDRTPGCRFEKQSGVLYFIDNAGYQGKTYFDIIGVLTTLYNVSVPKAISMIESSNTINGYIEKDIIEKEKVLPEIRFNYMKWPENNYFGYPDYYLKNENVYLVTDYWIKEKGQWTQNKIHNPRKTLTIAYYFPDTDHVKLYWPLEQKFRWYSNCTNDVFGASKLNYYLEKDNRLIIITKSQKDRLVFDYQCNIASIAPQSETASIDKEILDMCYKFKSQLIIYDNDLTGQFWASKLSEETGIPWKMFETYKDAFDNKNIIHGCTNDKRKIYYN